MNVTMGKITTCKEWQYQEKLLEKKKQIQTLQKLDTEIREKRREYYNLLGIPDPVILHKNSLTLKGTSGRARKTQKRERRNSKVG